MRQECAVCGTFCFHRVPRLPLASSLAVPDFAIVAIRYRDAGWMWRLVRQSLRMVEHPMMVGRQIPFSYRICRFLPLRPKCTVRIVKLSRAESKSAHKSEDCLPTYTLQSAQGQYRPKSHQVTRLLRWLLTQGYAATFPEVRRSVFSANPRQQNPIGSQANYRPFSLFTSLWEKAKSFALASSSYSNAS